MKMRLQKFLADAGLGSRRSCENLIATGRIRINGTTVQIQGIKVDPDADEIRIDGSLVKLKRKYYIALNKPRKFLCSRTSENGKRTVMDLLPSEWNHLYPVGRLDFDSEGLLLLTNDGDFSLAATHPRYGIRKKYIAMLDGKFPPERCAQLISGIQDEGEMLKAERAALLASNAQSSVVELVLIEGKKREIRRMFRQLSFKVDRLKRVQVGPIKLGDLPEGKWRNLQPAEVRSILDMTKKKPV